MHFNSTLRDLLGLSDNVYFGYLYSFQHFKVVIRRIFCACFVGFLILHTLVTSFCQFIGSFWRTMCIFSVRNQFNVRSLQLFSRYCSVMISRLISNLHPSLP